MNSSNDQVKQLVDQHQDSIRKINHSIMQSDFSPIHGIYIDLPVLKDTRMGLLLKESSGHQRAYLGQRLQQYNIRPNRSFLFSYPELPFSEEILQMKYKDPILSDSIFDFSPDTDLYQMLPIIMSKVSSRNSKANTTQKPTITLNIWPLQKTEMIMHFVKFMHLYLGVGTCDVKVISENPVTIPWVFWKNQQFLIVDDLISLSSSESELYLPLFEQQVCKNVTILAAWQASDHVLKIWKEEGTDFENIEHLKMRFELTALYFSICANFSFALFSIPIPEQFQQR